MSCRPSVCALLIACLAASASGCFLGGRGDRVVPVRLVAPAYETFFPHYVQLCAVSRFHRLGVERGGNAGHAVMYLKGVCRDENALYPTLRLCDERVDDVHDPRHGVGVSVNAAYRNVNWVAYPGRHLFFNGNLKDGQTLDQAHFEATIQAIVDQHLLRGVEVNEDRLTGILPGTLEHRIAESLLGTDTAIRFARSVWCTSLPLELPQVEAIVGYLNGLNRTYATGQRSYTYSLLSDNCVDALHNSLAAAGVWPHKTHYKLFARRLMNIGVPANEVVNFGARVNLFPIERFASVYRDDVMRDSLDHRDWLPARYGAITQSVPVHRPNELYDTSLQMYVVEGPGKRESKRAEEMLDDARYTDLATNLRYWEERYQRILDAPPERGWLAGEDWDRVQAEYLTYVAAQLADVKALLAREVAAD
jgi:hypothetical protein